MKTFLSVLTFTLLSLMVNGQTELTINCEPGVFVYVNGELIGMTSKEENGLYINNLKKGNINLKLIKEGYRPLENKLQLTKSPLEYTVDSSVFQKISNKEEADSLYVKVVDIMPVFEPKHCNNKQDGDLALQRFISENIEYPAKAKDSGISGKVYVSFIVNKKGKVIQEKVIKGIDPLLDKAALKVIRKLPDFSPGYLKGEAVNVQFNIPINFKLNTDNQKQTKD